MVADIVTKGLKEEAGLVLPPHQTITNDISVPGGPTRNLTGKKIGLLCSLNSVVQNVFIKFVKILPTDFVFWPPLNPLLYSGIFPIPLIESSCQIMYVYYSTNWKIAFYLETPTIDEDMQKACYE